MQAALPVLAFQAWELTTLKGNEILVDPVSDQNILGVSVKDIGDFSALISNTFIPNRPYREFSLSIPKINLKDTKVVVDTNNFEDNLAHLPGSALPGEKGNVFISGHSSLVEFFRPDNYKAIFSHLPEIGKGDQIEIDAGGQHFVYRVEGLRVVDPNDIAVVNPPDNEGRYLSLMTCVPPGFTTKRLVVLARLTGS